MRRLFGHTDFRHDLITPQEVAAAGGVEAGCTVRFVMSGETLVGKVNRVTKRATVLVKCSKNHPEVSCHDIAGIWVAFFSRCQRYRC